MDAVANLEWQELMGRGRQGCGSANAVCQCNAVREASPARVALWPDGLTLVQGQGAQSKSPDEVEPRRVMMTCHCTLPLYGVTGF